MEESIMGKSIMGKRITNKNYWTEHLKLNVILFSGGCVVTLVWYLIDNTHEYLYFPIIVTTLFLALAIINIFEGFRTGEFKSNRKH
jgi:hypothetical protein